MDEFRNTAASYFSKLTSLIKGIDYESIDTACNLIAEAWRGGRQIITLGNGGSALTALHFINDWNKSVFMQGKRQFLGRSLVDNIGLLMAYGNDVSFQDIFSEQLRNVVRPGDLVIAISGSGNSENVIRAVHCAHDHDAVTIGLCGYDGGRLKQLVQHCIWIPVNDMQLVEDMHMVFGHIVMQKLCGNC